MMLVDACEPAVARRRRLVETQEGFTTGERTVWAKSDVTPTSRSSSEKFRRRAASDFEYDFAIDGVIRSREWYNHKTKTGMWPMNKKNRRRVTGLIILFLASCGPIQSGQVEDQINAMIGLSQEHVLSCMGPPTSTAHVGATEVWSYNVGGPVTTSAVIGGNQSLVAGSATTSQEFCVVNLTLQNGSVAAANYRSQGKLLAPSLPCYSVLHACAPNPVPASTQAAAVADKTKEATAFCKQLYEDPRLNPLRGIISFDQEPTLEMQSNPRYVTNEQRPALDVYKSLNEQCRNNIATTNPRVWQIMVQIQTSPAEHLKQLYDRKITIGQYNTYRQEILEKFKQAIAGPPK